jgi:hypothetical protein
LLVVTPIRLAPGFEIALNSESAAICALLSADFKLSDSLLRGIIMVL